MARSSTASEDTALGSLDRQELRRLWIADGSGSLVDYTGYRNTDWVGDIQVTETVDQYIRTMSVQLRREAIVASTHLAAATASGSPNVDVDAADDFAVGEALTVGDTDGLTIDSISPGGGAGGSDRIVCTTNVGAVEPVDSAVVTKLSLAPLMNADPAPIDAGRKIICDVAVVPLGGTVDDATTYFWREVFNGYIDAGSWGGDESILELPCRGKGGLLKDRFITTLRTYGSDPPGTAIATVLQALLDDNLTSPPTLAVSGTPNFGIYEYQQRRQDVMSAMQEVASKQAGDLRYRWDDVDSAWELTYTILDRDASTPDVTYTSDDYYAVPGFVVDTAGVRNEVVGIYDRDSAGNESTVTARDDDSIAEFRERSMVLDFTADPQITTAGDAQAVIDLAIQDLAQPIAQQQVALALDWRLQMHDLVRMTANDVHYKDNQDQSITGLRHYIRGDPSQPWTTVVDLRGQPSGQVTRWYQKERARSTRDSVEAVGITVPTGTTPTGSVKVVGTRVGSNARIDFELKDVDLGFTQLRYKRRRSTDQGVDLNWETTWDLQTGTIGVDEDLTRSVYLQSEYTALIWEAIDGLGRKIGDEIDLSTFQVIEKTIQIPGAAFLPQTSSDDFVRDSAGRIRPSTTGVDRNYVKEVPLPVGVTLAEIASTGRRNDSGDTLELFFYSNEGTALGTRLADLTHAVSGAGDGTETATLNKQVEGDETYYVEATLNAVSVVFEARLTEVKFTYASPSYTRTY